MHRTRPIGLLLTHMLFNLYTSVSYNDEELKHNNITTRIDASMLQNARASEFDNKACEIKEAIEKIKLH